MPFEVPATRPTSTSRRLLRRGLLLAAGGAAATLLSACGGGDDCNSCGAGPGGPAAAAGYYDGSTSSGRHLQWIVLETGRYYGLYGPLNAPSSTVIEGLMIGDGTATGTNFDSNTLNDLNFTAQTGSLGSIAGTFRFRSYFDANVAYVGGATGSFTTDYSLRYEDTPSLTTIAGNYSGQLASVAAVTATNFNVSTSGALQAAVAGTCDIAGQLGVHLAGGNVYDVSLTYGPSCGGVSGTTVIGNAKYDGATGSLYIITSTSTFGSVALLLGTKT